MTLNEYHGYHVTIIVRDDITPKRLEGREANVIYPVYYEDDNNNTAEQDATELADYLAECAGRFAVRKRTGGEE